MSNRVLFFQLAVPITLIGLGLYFGPRSGWAIGSLMAGMLTFGVGALEIYQHRSKEFGAFLIGVCVTTVVLSLVYGGQS